VSGKLVRKFDGPEGQVIELAIGPPVPDENDWRCDVCIDGKLRYAMGVDAVQAMWLALCLAATELYTSAAYVAGELSWLGGADLGLPIPEVIRDDVAEDMKLAEELLATRQRGGR